MTDPINKYYVPDPKTGNPVEVNEYEWRKFTLEQGSSSLYNMETEVGKDITVVTRFKGYKNRLFETAATGGRYKEPIWIGSDTTVKAYNLHQRLVDSIRESNGISGEAA